MKDTLNNLSFIDSMTPGVERTWVVFNNGCSDGRWFTSLLKKNFKHCYIIHYDGYQWMRIEKAYSHIDLRMIISIDGLIICQQQNIIPYFQSLDNHTVVEVDRDKYIKQNTGKLRTRFPFVLQNCSSFAQDYLGVNGWIPHITPYQLFKRITKEV